MIIISTNVFKNTAGIAKALTIGDQSDISKEMRNAFSITGTTHILSVSGLHIGIIAGAIHGYFLS
jgi:competence protein ComEC